MLLIFYKTDQTGQSMLLLENQKQNAYECQEEQIPSRLKQEKKDNVLNQMAH